MNYGDIANIVTQLRDNMDNKKSLAEMEKKDYETANADYTADLTAGLEPDESVEEVLRWERERMEKAEEDYKAAVRAYETFRNIYI